jgi:hypothetical protein
MARRAYPRAIVLLGDAIIYLLEEMEVMRVRRSYQVIFVR